MQILIGTDPELFVRDTVTGRFVSAHDLIPGTKEDPYIVKHGAVQVDGVAAEFNINPAASQAEFVRNIHVVRDRLTQMVKECNPDYELVAEPTAYFEKEYFDALPDTPKLLGCTPDWNAYTGRQNTPPKTDEPFRTGSGHIHVGWGNYFDPLSDDHLALCCNLVKQLDAVLYPASHLWDQDMKRRTLYGARGSFRPKSYGLEWRPLSNAYLRSPATMRFVYDQVVGATELFFKGVHVYE